MKMQSFVIDEKMGNGVAMDPNYLPETPILVSMGKVRVDQLDAASVQGGRWVVEKTILGQFRRVRVSVLSESLINKIKMLVLSTAPTPAVENLQATLWAVTPCQYQSIVMGKDSGLRIELPWSRVQELQFRVAELEAML